MTRIQQSKLFLTVLAVAFIVFVGANFYFLGPIKGLAALFAVELFIIWNNRKQKENLKTFNVARKLFKKGRYDEAITMFLTFLKEAKERPDKERTTILNFGFYTNSAIAMSYNNIGASCIELGHYDKALESLERAIEVDVDYAIPYYNMAVAATMLNDDEKVGHCVERMSALGYKATLAEIIEKTEHLSKQVIDSEDDNLEE